MGNKVGLISFHKSINYGVYLQAYALQSFIEKAGYDVEIIDYNQFTEKKRNSKKVLHRLTHLKESFNIFRNLCYLRKKEVINKRNKFYKFAVTKFNLTNPIVSIAEIKQVQAQYVKFVCGSDQIWNPAYTQGNPVYFLRFAPQCKRIAYAPSFGVGQSSEAFNGYKEEYKVFLSEFSSLSVREGTGQRIIHDIANVNSTVVVDPTLLLSAEQWEIIGKEDNTTEREGEYVLFYVLGSNPLYRKLAKKIATQGKYRVVCIPTGPLWEKMKSVDKCYAGVNEFILLFRRASFIVTDSFHGTVFSVIFRKKFSAILRNDTNYSLCSRIEDFLGNIHLENNCVNVSEVLNIELDKEIDYSQSDILLNDWIEESKFFLKTALAKNSKGN